LRNYLDRRPPYGNACAALRGAIKAAKLTNAVSRAAVCSRHLTENRGGLSVRALRLKLIFLLTDGHRRMEDDTHPNRELAFPRPLNQSKPRHPYLEEHD
jgi:hypothetical protein